MVMTAKRWTFAFIVLIVNGEKHFDVKLTVSGGVCPKMVGWRLATWALIFTKLFKKLRQNHTI